MGEEGRRFSDGAVPREPTLSEYLAATGGKADAAAFDLKLTSDRAYQTFVFIKSRDVESGTRQVACVSSVATVATKGTPELVICYPTAQRASLDLFQGGRNWQMPAAVSPAYTRFVECASGRAGLVPVSQDDAAAGRPLPAIPGVKKRFALKRVAYGRAVSGGSAVAATEFELEFCVMESAADFDARSAERDLLRAIEGEWKNDGAPSRSR